MLQGKSINFDLKMNPSVCILYLKSRMVFNNLNYYKEKPTSKYNENT